MDPWEAHAALKITFAFEKTPPLASVGRCNHRWPKLDI